MKHTISRCLALALAAVFALSCGMTALAAGNGVTTVQVDVTYGQTEARQMLALLNDFRTGDEAWYWNADNSTKTVLTDLNELTYDYTLEQTAMQRAAEIALSFSHTRPDGTSCFTAGASMGENIAAGYPTMQAAFEAWQETNENYSGQGHRRNMLSSGYTAVGIGHVYYNGVHYWVQEFGYTSDTTATAAVDTTRSVSISVSDGQIASAAVTGIPEQLTLTVGDSVSLPTADVSLRLTSAWPGRISSVTAIPDWSAQPDGIVELSGATLTAKKTGTAVLTAQVCGQTVSVSVSVSRFADVAADAWYCQAMEYAADNGLLQGVGDNRMNPEGDMTRAMFVTVLHRMAGTPSAVGSSPFNDLTDDWYLEAVQWAYENQITLGASDTQFAPNGSVTREQLAVFLYRYAQYVGADVTSGVTDERYNSFADRTEVDDWAQQAMIWATSTGVINGSDVGLEPLRDTSRAECAQMFMNFAQNILALG